MPNPFSGMPNQAPRFEDRLRDLMAQRKAFEQNVMARLQYQYGAPESVMQKAGSQEMWAGLSPADRKAIEADVIKRMHMQFGGADRMLNTMHDWGASQQ